ncbi:sigma factor [Bacillus stercoris]|nr:sigma factor [Bacillus stercoris]
MDILSDEELMEKVKQKDMEAYNSLYARHALKTYQFIFLYIRQKQAAEDLLQETFIRVYVKCRSYKSEKASFRTYSIKSLTDYVLIITESILNSNGSRWNWTIIRKSTRAPLSKIYKIKY